MNEHLLDVRAHQPTQCSLTQHQNYSLVTRDLIFPTRKEKTEKMANKHQTKKMNDDEKWEKINLHWEKFLINLGNKMLTTQWQQSDLIVFAVACDVPIADAQQMLSNPNFDRLRSIIEMLLKIAYRHEKGAKETLPVFQRGLKTLGRPFLLANVLKQTFGFSVCFS